jgi:hypothetical protein
VLLVGPSIDLTLGSVQENDLSGGHFSAHRPLPDLRKGSSITARPFSRKIVCRYVEKYSYPSAVPNLEQPTTLAFCHVYILRGMTDITSSLRAIDAVYSLIASDNATEDREGQKIGNKYPAPTTSRTKLLLWPVVLLYSPEKNVILL